MAFRLPAFNLTFNAKVMPTVYPVLTIPTPPYRLVSSPCQLTYGRRVNMMGTGGTNQPGVLVVAMNLLVPALTDIRGFQDSINNDMIECPAGSGRWYVCYSVDDIGKGFTNEHRTGCIFSLAGSWVAPYP